jgi:restriction system protein
MILYAVIAVILIIGIIILTFIKRHQAGIPSSSFPQSIEDTEDLTAVDINRIDQMEDGSEFELYIAKLLVELGYRGVYKTTGSRDFGADVVFIDSLGNQTVIQAKRYSTDSSVGLSAVQEIFTSKRFKARNAIVTATTRFTESCETLAGVNHVLLIDRNDLIKIIDLFKLGNHSQARAMIEAEPRTILESWTDIKEEYRVIKKDKKAEKLLKSGVGS